MRRKQIEIHMPGRRRAERRRLRPNESALGAIGPTVAAPCVNQRAKQELEAADHSPDHRGGSFLGTTRSPYLFLQE